jgi:single-stranded-DNA-specific exonuclease
MRWETAQPDRQLRSQLETELGVSPFLASLLVGRGLDTPDVAKDFLDPKLSSFANPLDLPQLKVAAERICQAIRNREKVVVYGDYDVDGITSVSLLLAFFRDVGFSASYMLPSRFRDGYGLNPARVKEIADEGYQLLITVDCGSASRKEVQYLAERNVDVIVTDHHRVQGDIPEALAFINPDGWEADNEWQVLAGVGVAYLLVMAVHILLKSDERFAERLQPLKSYLDIVTLGTVADMVPLRGPNRALVVHGLAYMAGSQTRPGVVALREVSGLAGKPVDTTSIAFYMAPRINAAGRLGNAEIGVELLLSPSLHKALVLAKQLNDDNQKRRDLEGGIFEEADRVVATAMERRDMRAIVLASPDWHKGVLGIVASRLCEKYFRPTILMNIEEGLATGSGRSIPGFDLAAALEGCSEMLTRHGGHAMAAGLTVEVGKLDAFREHLEAQVAEALPETELEPMLAVDAVVPLEAVDNRMIVDLERLGPYGMGNQEPVVGVRNITVKSRQIVGGDHLKLNVEQQNRVIEAIGFRMADRVVKRGDSIDIAFFPEIRAWGGMSYLQLRLKDLQQSAREE